MCWLEVSFLVAVDLLQDDGPQDDWPVVAGAFVGEDARDASTDFKTLFRLTHIKSPQEPVVIVGYLNFVLQNAWSGCSVIVRWVQGALVGAWSFFSG